MYKALTYLKPKKSNPDAQDYRPISCLSNIYKLITKVISSNLYLILEANNVINYNQLCARRNCFAAKEQLIYNHCINLFNDFNLKVLWVDIKKAFDSVPFNYLNRTLETLKILDNIIKLVKCMQDNMELNLKHEKSSLGAIKPRKEILQGYSLSPLLFVICMEPISRTLNDNELVKVTMKYEDKEIKVNHLFYIDDLKLMANDDKNLNILSHKLDEILHIIGLELNKNKSATNSHMCKEISGIISEVEGYKYLGLIEYVDCQNKHVNIVNVFDKIKQRIIRLCDTKLTGKNLFLAKNEYAISLLNYYVGIINYSNMT
ncbi:LINE-1 retrotransposable element ORF2 protein [Dictyocoela muelleri]|nr:LINE-1 retrotransposable element ORF2 protein [Dictyocoela muelleri]